MDLDPQGAAAFYYRVAPGENPGSGEPEEISGDWVRKISRESDFPGLDILPSNLAFRNLDVQLAEMKKPRKQLARLMQELDGAYDAIVIDCPPNITLLSENVFRASTAILIPVIPTPLRPARFPSSRSSSAQRNSISESSFLLLDGSARQAAAPRPHDRAPQRSSRSSCTRKSLFPSMWKPWASIACPCWPGHLSAPPPRPTGRSATRFHQYAPPPYEISTPRIRKTLPSQFESTSD